MDYNFSNALFLEALELGSPVELYRLRDLAKAQIFQGLGSQLVNTTVNGKTMSFQIKKSADEIYSAAGKAIDRYNNGDRCSIGFDFTGLMT